MFPEELRETICYSAFNLLPLGHLPPQLSRIIFNCFSSAVKTWNFIFNNSVVFIIVKFVTQLPIECFYLLFLSLIEFMHLWFRYLHGEAEGVYQLWVMSQLRSLKINRRILCIGNSLFPVSVSWCPRSFCFKRFAWFSACASCLNYNGNASSSASAIPWCYECYNCVFLEWISIFFIFWNVCFRNCRKDLTDDAIHSEQMLAMLYCMAILRWTSFFSCCMAILRWTTPPRLLLYCMAFLTWVKNLEGWVRKSSLSTYWWCLGDSYIDAQAISSGKSRLEI